MSLWESVNQRIKLHQVYYLLAKAMKCIALRSSFNVRGNERSSNEKLGTLQAIKLGNKRGRFLLFFEF